MRVAYTGGRETLREFTIRICDACYALDGEMCHNPECVFCRRTMKEVGEYLDVLLIRPLVNGERLDLHPLEEATTPAAEGAQGALRELVHEALALAERLVNDVRMCRDRDELWQHVGWRDDLSYVHQQIARAKAALAEAAERPAPREFVRYKMVQIADAENGKPPRYRVYGFRPDGLQVEVDTLYLRDVATPVPPSSEREALIAIQAQCAGHADEFSQRVWQIATAALRAATGGERT